MLHGYQCLDYEQPPEKREGGREGWWEGGREGGKDGGRLTWRSHMVCMLPCVAKVRRCGQQEWAVRIKERGTDIACRMPASTFS